MKITPFAVIIVFGVLAGLLWQITWLFFVSLALLIVLLVSGLTGAKTVQGSAEGITAADEEEALPVVLISQRREQPLYEDVSEDIAHDVATRMIRDDITGKTTAYGKRMHSLREHGAMLREDTTHHLTTPVHLAAHKYKMLKKYGRKIEPIW